jgi:hypothetical protein
MDKVLGLSKKEGNTFYYANSINYCPDRWLLPCDTGKRRNVIDA